MSLTYLFSMYSRSKRDVIDILNFNLHFEFIFDFTFKFTYEVEHNSKISLLDILLMTSNRELETTVFCKETNNHIYLHWRSFVSITWKKGAFRTLVR